MRKSVLVAVGLFLLVIMSAVAQPNILYVNLRTANLRSCPETSCRIITALRPGTAVTVLETVRGQRFAGSSDWYHIRASSQAGYVHSSLLTAADPGIGSQYVTFTPTPFPTYPPIPTSMPDGISLAPPQITCQSSGGTALCNDGWCSFSERRQGTCSSHGGVAVWYKDVP